jgi:hypothetical protein
MVEDKIRRDGHLTVVATLIARRDEITTVSEGDSSARAVPLTARPRGRERSRRPRPRRHFVRNSKSFAAFRERGLGLSFPRRFATMA